MSSIADRVAAKRAAATQMEGNTKKTMEGISGWSASSDASSSASSGVCGGMSEFHDLQANAGKKSRKDSNTNDTKKATESKKKDVVDPVKKTEENHTTQANKASTANSATTATTEASSSPESDCSSPAASPSSCESSIVETVKTSRQKRAEERNVNSTGPMVLSRHISWLISQGSFACYFSPCSHSLVVYSCTFYVRTQDEPCTLNSATMTQFMFPSMSRATLQSQATWNLSSTILFHLIEAHTTQTDVPYIVSCTDRI